jgi:peroxiredoxin
MTMAKFVLFALMLGALAFGKPAPLFHGEGLGGKKVSLSETLKPGRGVLVCFWASWCTPCLEELKHIKDYVKAHPEFPLDVLTVNVDTSETSSDVAPTVKLYGIEFPVLLDPAHEIFAKYQSAKQLPYSVLVNGQGQVEKSFQGYQPDLFAQIDTALKGKPNDSKKN